MTVRKLLLDWPAALVGSPVNPQTVETIGNGRVYGRRGCFFASVISSTQRPMLSELAGGRSKLAAFQHKIVFRIAVKVATQSADFSLKALRHVYLDKPVAIPLYLNTDVGH